MGSESGENVSTTTMTKRVGELVGIMCLLLLQKRLQPVFNWHVHIIILQMVLHTTFLPCLEVHILRLFPLFGYVNALNSCPDFHISYLESFEVQKKIAAGVQKARIHGIYNCVAATVCILSQI